MSDQKAKDEEILAEQADLDEDKNERSTIAFPYLALDAAEEVARAVWNRASTRTCPADELAAEMGQNISGAFRQKTSGARVFGLVDKDGRSGFRLTELGRRFVQPGGERIGRVDAFLAVPLYAKLYENHKGRLLPPSKALESEMQALGVSSKQTDRARQAFERSARQAGFFDAGENRLVKPKVEGGSEREAPTAESGEISEASAGTAGATTSDDKLALIKLLVSRLPENLTNEKLAQWLRAAEVNLRWSHNIDGEIKIEIVKPEAK
jgi:hypothetical protein